MNPLIMLLITLDIYISVTTFYSLSYLKSGLFWTESLLFLGLPKNRLKT